MQLVVVGGGVSGLAAAHFARHRMPVTLVNSKQITGKLGGWAQTQDGVEVGPRSIRMGPESPIVLDVAAELGMLEEVVPTKLDYQNAIHSEYLSR